MHICLDEAITFPILLGLWLEKLGLLMHFNKYLNLKFLVAQLLYDLHLRKENI